MTVAELIRQLSRMDQNLPACIEDADGVVHDIDDVYETEDDEDQQVIAISVDKS